MLWSATKQCLDQALYKIKTIIININNIIKICIMPILVDVIIDVVCDFKEPNIPIDHARKQCTFTV